MIKIGNRLLFYLVLKPLSFLPMALLFLFYDVTFFLTYHILKYRKEVVLDNLKNYFQNISNIELRDIENKLYRHFTDIIFEVIKSINISDKNVFKRTSIKNFELSDIYYQQGRNIIVVCDHYNNSEFYELSLPKIFNDKFITDKYTSILEDIINKRPEFWLWSHKRWKHKTHINIISS